MSIILFDTNILIDHLKGKAEAAQLLKQCINSEKQLACSAITRIELFSGLRSGEEVMLNRFLSGFDEIDVTAKIANISGYYMNSFRKSHGMNMADAIIAATAKYLDAELYTLNLKHYPMDDIKIVRPY